MDRELYFPAHRGGQDRAPLELMNERRPHQLYALTAEIFERAFNTNSGGNRTFRAFNRHPANMRVPWPGSSHYPLPQ